MAKGRLTTMKLTGDLKKQVEQAASMEEARSLIEQAGMELTDDELETVAGGSNMIRTGEYLWIKK